VRESVASRKKRFLAAALLQRQYDIMTSLAATLQPIKRSEGRLQQPISSQRADTKRIKGELPSKKAHSTRQERVCRISPIDREYPSLS